MNPPKKITFLIALILGALGIVSQFVSIPFVKNYDFWFVAAGWALLILGCCFKGL